jgi:hypothetical protein
VVKILRHNVTSNCWYSNEECSSTLRPKEITAIYCVTRYETNYVRWNLQLNIVTFHYITADNAERSQYRFNDLQNFSWSSNFVYLRIQGTSMHWRFSSSYLDLLFSTRFEITFRVFYKWDKTVLLLPQLHYLRNENMRGEVSFTVTRADFFVIVHFQGTNFLQTKSVKSRHTVSYQYSLSNTPFQISVSMHFDRRRNVDRPRIISTDQHPWRRSKVWIAYVYLITTDDDKYCQLKY